MRGAAKPRFLGAILTHGEDSETSCDCLIGEGELAESNACHERESPHEIDINGELQTRTAWRWAMYPCSPTRVAERAIDSCSRSGAPRQKSWRGWSTISGGGFTVSAASSPRS